MIIKNTLPDIDAENPFQEDKLGRSNSAENLTLLIKTITQPFVLSIDSPWGTGKTTFIKMWDRKMENEGIPCLYFNAWEHDYFDDPLISFVGAIQSNIDNFKIAENSKSKAKKYLDEAKKVTGKLIRRSIPLALKVGTAGVLDLSAFAEKSISEYIEKFAKDQIDSYEANRTSLNEFRNSLQSFVAELAGSNEKHGNSLVFFIDELDRCRPSYALELLERIKHLFSVNGIVFVLAVDKRQLVNSVKAIYGYKIDAENYLRRFIDLSYQLPQAKPDKFCEYLFEKFDLASIFKARNDKFGSRDYDKEQLIGVFSAFSDIFGLSPRVQEQCFGQFAIVVRTMPINKSIHPILLAFLIALKAANETLYYDFVSRKEDPAKVLEYIKRFGRGQSFLYENYGEALEAYLVSGFSSINDFRRIIQSYLTMSRQENTPNEDQERAARIADTLNNLMQNRYQETTTSLAKRIEMAEKFEVH